MNKEKEEEVKQALSRWEKEQESLNKQKEGLIKTLKGEDKKKLKAVEAAIKILTDAEVPFLMFCNQKFLGSEEEGSIQYNNFGELSKKLGKLEGVIDWTHNVTLGIWNYINMMAQRKSILGGIKEYDPVALWFWGSVKDEYRLKNYTQPKESNNKYPAQ